MIDVGQMLLGALALAARGFHVFPVQPGSKVPVREHGYRFATTDPAEILAQWRELPHANVAIAPGPSGLVVVDVDCKNGKPGLNWLKENGHRLPATLTARSPSGGAHLYFQAPTGLDVMTRTDRISLGVDVRGTRGSILAPPSVLDGRPYQWSVEQSIAIPPDWLVDAWR